MFKFIKVAIISVFITSCAGLSTKTVNDEKLSKIRKVAIIGFELQAPASGTIGLNLGSGKAEGGAGGSMLPKNSEVAEKMLYSFVNALSKQKKWMVIDPNTMKQNAGYQQAYKNTMEGWQSKGMKSMSGANYYRVQGIMDTESMNILKQEGRDRLMKELGVDAVITVYVNGYYEGTTVMGFGTRYPTARANLQMKSLGTDEYIWFETLQGEKSSQSAGATGFVNEDKVNQLLLESFKTSLKF